MIKEIVIQASKKIFILFGIIIGGFVIFWLILGAVIIISDTRDNKRKAMSYYAEDIKKYEKSERSPFLMKYTYSAKTNFGFYESGGYINGTECWERFIKDAWSGEEIIFISTCDGEDLDNEAKKKIEEFWEKDREIFK
jgi:hypothetical protein